MSVKESDRGMTIVQYSKVELCGVNTSRLRVMTEE